MMKKAILLGASLLFLGVGVRAQSIDDARKALDEEKYAKAKGILESLVQKQPKKGINYFYLGQVHIKNEYLDSAKMVFEKGLEADPKTRLNTVGLGILNLFEGKVDAAEQIFSQIVSKLGKKDYQELYHIGRAYVDAPEPDYGKALQYLNQALTRAGKKPDPTIYLAIGDAYYGAKEPSPAYSNYRDAADLNPNLTRAEVQMAVIARGARAFQEAIDALNLIVEKRPDYAPTYRELAVTYNAWSLRVSDSLQYRQLNKTAVENFKKFMDLTDYSIESRVRYADFLVFAGEYDELEAQAKELASIENVNPKVYRYLGFSLYGKNDFAGTEEALGKLMQTMPEEHRIARDYLFYGVSKVRLATATVPSDMEKFEEGLSAIRSAVAKDSTSANDLNVTGRALFSARKFKEAAKFFEIPANTEGSRNQVTDTYYFALAALYANSSSATKDEELVRKADKAFAYVIEKADNLLEPYLRRAQNINLLEDNNNPTGIAKPYVEAFVAKLNESSEEEVNKYKKELVAFYTAWAYQAVQKEDFASARKYTDEALKLMPEDNYANQVAEYLNQVEARNKGSR